MKVCPSCGAETGDRVKFCGSCGFSFLSVETKTDSDLELLRKHLSPKFQVEKQLGEGGMALVYIGEQSALDRQVVIKLLKQELSKDAGMRDRFLQEAKTSAKLKHPNIIDIIDVGIADERPYFIMEYISRGSLDEYLKSKGNLEITEVAGIVSKILKGLSLAHKQSVVHRDIKPENILLREDNEPVIVDFGIAKVSGAAKTQTGLTMGTVSYMSPEQCMGQADIDGRSDIYSVGIMLYELLTGEVPFKGEHAISVVNMHVNTAFPDMRKLKNAKEIPDSMIKIIEKACAKDKTERYATALEMKDALEGVGTDLKPVHVPEEPKKEKATDNKPAETYGRASFPKWIFPVIAILVLAVSGWFGYDYLKMKQPEEEGLLEFAKQKESCEKAGYAWNENSCVDNGNWSEYMGAMNWEAAKAKCSSIGMNLPTRSQLLDVYNSGIEKEWLKVGTYFWSSEEFSDENAYGVSMGNGDVDYYGKDYDNGDVRCVR